MTDGHAEHYTPRVYVARIREVHRFFPTARSCRLELKLARRPCRHFSTSWQLVAVEAPALFRRADVRVHQVGTPGTPLGVLDRVGLVDVRFRPALGDLLPLRTDGACEARPRPGTPSGRWQRVFGDAELAAALSGTCGRDAEATVKGVGKALADHHDGWTSDDTALLALRVLASS
ncbi:hypothetical protein DBP15_05235 [Streptomyces sp. CS065A]|nr:hypothetical protein DBP15_05235 [Streptomyces sp. CS065A]